MDSFFADTATMRWNRVNNHLQSFGYQISGYGNVKPEVSNADHDYRACAVSSKNFKGILKEYGGDLVFNYERKKWFLRYKNFHFTDEISEPSAEAIELAVSQASELVSVSESYQNLVKSLCPVGGTGKPAILQEKKSALTIGFKYLVSNPKADFRMASNHVVANSCRYARTVEKWMYEFYVTGNIKISKKHRAKLAAWEEIPQDIKHYLREKSYALRFDEVKPRAPQWTDFCDWLKEKNIELSERQIKNMLKD